MTLAVRFAVCAGIAATGSARASVMGSELIDRVLLDASSGLSLIYRGDMQPLAGDGAVADVFSVYTRGGAGTFWVTPFLLEVTGASQYTVVAIGTSRDLSGDAGVRSFDFDVIAGNATLEAGKSYSFGYRNAQHEADGTGGVSGVANTSHNGRIPFTGYNDFSDPWSYAFADLNIGTIFGDGGVGLDTQGFNGRIYSAQLSTIPAPGTAGAIALGCLAAMRRRR